MTRTSSDDVPCGIAMAEDDVIDCGTCTDHGRRLWVMKRAYVKLRLALALDRFMQKQTRCKKVSDARWVNAWATLYNALDARHDGLD